MTSDHSKTQWSSVYTMRLTVRNSVQLAPTSISCRISANGCSQRAYPFPFGLLCHALFFFFSSRRRHTRLQGDWSSDVCSSDLSFVFFVVKCLHARFTGTSRPLCRLRPPGAPRPAGRPPPSPRAAASTARRPDRLDRKSVV